MDAARRLGQALEDEGVLARRLDEVDGWDAACYCDVHERPEHVIVGLVYKDEIRPLGGQVVFGCVNKSDRGR